MTFWVVLRTASSVHFVAPVLAELRRRGCSLHLSFTYPIDEAADAPALDWLAEQVGDFSLVPIDFDEGSRLRWWYWRAIVRPARELRSYAELARYWPPLLRTRSVKHVAPRLRVFLLRTNRRGLRWIIENPATRAILRAVELRYEPPAGLDRLIGSLAPDCVVASPMIYPATREVDAVRAAKRRGIPTYCFVLSWDNLSSKGAFHELPDQILVWNETQREEAAWYHRLPRARVELVGAPVFDYLSSPTILRPRSDFLAELELDGPDRYYLYAVSSILGVGAGGEVEIVTNLLAQMRRTFGSQEMPYLVVRPHPKNMSGWDALHDERLRIWRRPSFAHSDGARADLYNSLVHAEALVGLNTSMFIEAAILDRPCVSMRFSRSGRDDRRSTTVRHYSYLLNAGFLHAVEDEEEAARELKAILDGHDPFRAERAAFVRSFIRPPEPDRPAAEVAADRLVALARSSR